MLSLIIKGAKGILYRQKKNQNNYSFNWANDESFWSQNKVTSPGMRTLKNSYNNGNRSARSVFVVSWNLLLTRAGGFFCRLEIFIAYWHLLIISLKCYLFSRGCVFWSRRGWVKETALLSTSSLDLAAPAGACSSPKRRPLTEHRKKTHVHGKIFLSAMSSLKSNCLWKPTDRLEENVFIWWSGIFFKNICHQSLFYVKLSIEYNGWLIFQSIYIYYSIPVGECGFLAITIHLLNCNR